MKSLFLSLCVAVFFLNGQIAQAENDDDLDMTHCVAPSKEQEEFEPSLCPFKLPDVKKIEITERIKESKDIYYNANDCSKFQKITKKQVLRFLNSANRVSHNDLHAKLPEVSPCRISGKIHFKDGTTGNWTLLQSINLGYLSSPQFPNLINLYCPESCGFIPTYESHNNKQ